MNHRTFAGLLVLLSGCRVPLDKQEVVGAWESRRGERVSCVYVKLDGSYTQVITFAGREELSTSSTWTWELKSDEGMGILFKQFQHLNDRGEAADRPAGLWLVVPERRAPFGIPRLVVSDDEGIFYRKRSTACDAPAR